MGLILFIPIVWRSFVIPFMGHTTRLLETPFLIRLTVTYLRHFQNAVLILTRQKLNRSHWLKARLFSNR